MMNYYIIIIHHYHSLAEESLQFDLCYLVLRSLPRYPSVHPGNIITDKNLHFAWVSCHLLLRKEQPM